MDRCTVWLRSCKPRESPSCENTSSPSSHHIAPSDRCATICRCHAMSWMIPRGLLQQQAPSALAFAARIPRNPGASGHLDGQRRGFGLGCRSGAPKLPLAEFRSADSKQPNRDGIQFLAIAATGRQHAPQPLLGVSVQQCVRSSQDAAVAKPPLNQVHQAIGRPRLAPEHIPGDLRGARPSIEGQRSVPLDLGWAQVCKGAALPSGLKTTWRTAAGRRKRNERKVL
mmetsp:Transcript_135151/g.431955  ORF Transcript_135151/g.431955 Transcript_135151/m.431955 type:complete len:226 (-) Transcript_135151:275-952(-)